METRKALKAILFSMVPAAAGLMAAPMPAWGSYSVTMTVPDVPDGSPTNPDGFSEDGGSNYYSAVDAAPSDSDFFILYVDTQFTGGSSPGNDGFYEEFGGAPASGPYQINITNDPASIDTFDNGGYFISETYIPLDQLNPTYESTPGSPASPFTQVPGLDGRTEGPGQTDSATTPLPRSVWGGLALLVGLGAGAKLRRRLID